jgi:hypothetical protein
MKKFDQIEQEALFEEVEDDYFRTMNSIIARKHISESRNELTPTNLIVSLDKNPRPAPTYGLIDVKRGKNIIIE